MSNKSIHIIQLQKEIESLDKEIKISSLVVNAKIFRAHIAVSGIKMVTTMKGGEWVKESEDVFFETVSVTQEDPDAKHFFNMYGATCIAKRLDLVRELAQLVAL